MKHKFWSKIEKMSVRLVDTIRNVSYRTLSAVFLLTLGVALAAYPDAHAGIYMAQMGISPKGYALVIVLIGGFVLRHPKTDLYPMLMIPYLLYVFAVHQYTVVELKGAPTATIVYLAVWLLMQRASVDKE